MHHHWPFSRLWPLQQRHLRADRLQRQPFAVQPVPGGQRGLQARVRLRGAVQQRVCVYLDSDSVPLTLAPQQTCQASTGTCVSKPANTFCPVGTGLCVEGACLEGAAVLFNFVSSLRRVERGGARPSPAPPACLGTPPPIEPEPRRDCSSPALQPELPHPPPRPCPQPNYARVDPFPPFDRTTYTSVLPVPPAGQTVSYPNVVNTPLPNFPNK